MRITMTDGAGHILEGPVGLTAQYYYTAKDQLFITPLSPECLGMELMGVDTGVASGTLTQNTVYAVPLTPEADFTVKRMFWANGTVSNGNADMGVYNWAASSKIISTGQTAQGSVSVLQSVDVADTVLLAGVRYWMAFGMDSATGTYVRAQTSAIGVNQYAGQMNQTSGYSGGLPASLTLAAPAVTGLPLFGICGYTVS